MGLRLPEQEEEFMAWLMAQPTGFDLARAAGTKSSVWLATGVATMDRRDLPICFVRFGKRYRHQAFIENGQQEICGPFNHATEAAVQSGCNAFRRAFQSAPISTATSAYRQSSVEGRITKMELQSDRANFA